MTLNSKHPFAPNDIASSMRRNENPRLILEQSIELNIHGSTPVGVFHSIGEAGGFNNGRIAIGEECTGNRISHGTIGEGFGFGD